jgi:signal transduction histidine kinase
LPTTNPGRRLWRGPSGADTKTSPEFSVVTALDNLFPFDTGISIHPHFLPHIFERFRQANADSTTGLGLGLAIVKNLVELHGGTVVATSEGRGRGAQFTVTLPRNSGAAS